MKRIPLDSIRIDGDTQVRSSMNHDAVDAYADAIQEGERLPPVTVFYDGSEYWLADGFHRYHACEKLGLRDIDAEVKEGTLQDALWYALGANKKNGMRLGRADVERAIKMALLHPEVVPDGVNTNRGLAAHIGCDHKTVEKFRGELISVGEIPQQGTRKGKDGKTYQAKKPAPKHPEPEVQQVQRSVAPRGAAPRPDQVGARDPNLPDPIWPDLGAGTEPPQVNNDYYDENEAQAAVASAVERIRSNPNAGIDADAAIMESRIDSLCTALDKVLKFGDLTAADVQGYGITSGRAIMLADSVYKLIGGWMENPAEALKTHDQFTIDAP